MIFNVHSFFIQPIHNVSAIPLRGNGMNEYNVRRRKKNEHKINQHLNETKRKWIRYRGINIILLNGLERLALKLSTPLFCNYQEGTALFYIRYNRTHTHTPQFPVEIRCSDSVVRLKFLLQRIFVCIWCHPFSHRPLTLHRLLSNLKYFFQFKYTHTSRTMEITIFGFECSANATVFVLFCPRFCFFFLMFYFFF